MHMVRTALAAACMAAAVLATAASPPADAQPRRLQVGQLNCSLSSGVGLVIGSERNVSCIFHSDNAPDETYSGSMRRIGLDIGATSGGRIVWAVFASTDRYAGMLDGTYVGATAEASVALGLGANVLVGSSNSSIALQPLSVQGQVGLNIAAGVGKLYLCEQGTSCPAP
jgi:hypothetical protein